MPRWIKTALFVAVAITAFAFAGSLQAVSRSDSGSGQALIVPVWSTAAGNQTLLTIRNSITPTSKALKVRFLAGDDGSELHSFNLYLERDGVWVAALEAQGDGSVLTTPDTDCLLPEPVGGVVAELNRTIGSIEIVEMADAEDIDIISLIDDEQCEDLASAWSGGFWTSDPAFGLMPPLGGVGATAQIVHREKGTLYEVETTALTHFSDIVQHTNPTSDVPNISTPHDSGTESGQTTAKICVGSNCQETLWPTPAMAARAALATRELHGDFTVEAAAGASAEFVMHAPLARYGQGELPISVSLLLVGRQGQTFTQPCSMPTSPFICETSFWTSIPDPLFTVVLQNGDGSPPDNTSPIIGIPISFAFPGDQWFVDAGWARLGIDSEFEAPDGPRVLGDAVIAVRFQEFVNGNLQGKDGVQQRANYGGAAPMSETREIVDDG